MIKAAAKFFYCVASGFICIACLAIAYAHAGKTGEDGGHWDRSTGDYHYHHGYPAHEHIDGVCPYNYDDQTDHSSGGSSLGVSTTINPNVTLEPKPTASPKYIVTTPHVVEKTAEGKVKANWELIINLAALAFSVVIIILSQFLSASSKGKKTTYDGANIMKNTPKVPLNDWGKVEAECLQKPEDDTIKEGPKQNTFSSEIHQIPSDSVLKKKTQAWKYIVCGLLVCLLVVSSVYLGYAKGIETASANYSTYYDDGFAAGREEGYDVGFETGERMSESKYDAEYNRGYDVGYDVGYERGYSYGRKDAMDGNYNSSRDSYGPGDKIISED